MTTRLDYEATVERLVKERDEARERLAVLTEAARKVIHHVDAIPIQPANGLRVGWLRDAAEELRAAVSSIPETGDES